MAGAALMNGFANMGNAFMRSYQAESDRLRQQARQDAEAQWQNELRGRQRKTWGREDAEEAAIAAAFKPVQGETPQDGVAAGMASRGIGVAQEEGDSTYRQQLRAADALMPINPKRAIEMRNAAMGSRSTELGLKKAERDEINEHYNNMLVGALDSAPTWYEGAVNFAKEAMGANVVYELSEDGKRVNLYGIEADGKRKLTGTYKADGSGALEFLDKASKQDAKTKMAMLRANMEYERARADKAEDREADLAGRERLARTEAGLREGAAARASARSQASDAERAAAGVALYQERNPNATSAEIEAVRRGILPAVQNAAKDAPSEVKLATAMVEAGLAPDMRAGLEMAVTKKSQSARETYLNLMKPNSYGWPPKEQDVAPVMEAAYGPDWRAKVNGGTTDGPQKIRSAAELARLPSGARYTAPDGTVRVKR